LFELLLIMLNQLWVSGNIILSKLQFRLCHIFWPLSWVGLGLSQGFHFGPHNIAICFTLHHPLVFPQIKQPIADAIWSLSSMGQYQWHWCTMLELIDIGLNSMKQIKKRIRKHHSNIKLVQKYLVQSDNIGLPLTQLATLVIRCGPICNSLFSFQFQLIIIQTNCIIHNSKKNCIIQTSISKKDLVTPLYWVCSVGGGL
jgi:hypothetical protein